MEWKYKLIFLLLLLCLVQINNSYSQNCITFHYDENGNRLFSLIVSDGKFSLPILPVGQYNLSVENIGTPNIRQSNDSITFIYIDIYTHNFTSLNLYLI